MILLFRTNTAYISIFLTSLIYSIYPDTYIITIYQYILDTLMNEVYIAVVKREVREEHYHQVLNV